MNNKKKGFSLVGLLVLLVVAAVAIVLTASVMTRRHLAKDDETDSMSHGTYVCYNEFDEATDTWVEREVAFVDGVARVSRAGCSTLSNLNAVDSYIPKQAKNFNITLIGGGGGGSISSVSNFNDPNSDQYFIETLAEKRFDFRFEDPGRPKGVDFSLSGIQSEDIRRLFEDFINNHITIEIKVGGGGGAGAVLNGLRADNQVLKGDWLGIFSKIAEETSQKIKELFGNGSGVMLSLHNWIWGREDKSLNDFDEHQSVGLNYCRCTKLFDGRTFNKDENGRRTDIEFPANNINVSALDSDNIYNTIQNQGLSYFFSHAIAEGVAEKRWTWDVDGASSPPHSGYPACYSPQCARGRGVENLCNAIDDNNNHTYSVAARGGTGGACQTTYMPRVGHHISFQIGKGAQFSDYAPKGNAFDINSYPSRGGDGFIQLPNNNFVAKGGDAPQYRAVESGKVLNTQAFCPVHASVESCGREKNDGIKARMCHAKANRGDGACVINGNKDSTIGIRQGGEGGFGYAENIDITKRSNAVPSRSSGYNGQGEIIITLKNDENGAYVFNGINGVIYRYYGGIDPRTNSPYTSQSSNPFAIMAQRVNVIVSEGQSGEPGKYKNNIRKTRLTQADLNGLQIGTGGNQGMSGEPTIAFGHVANGGGAGSIQKRSYVAQNGNNITVNNYSGQTGVGSIHNTPNINQQGEHSHITFDENHIPNGVTSSRVFGGSGAGGAIVFNGGNVINNAGARVALIEYTNNPDGTITINKQTPIYGTGNAPNALTEVHTFAGRGGGGAVIITW